MKRDEGKTEEVRILFVDDEENVRNVVQGILEEAGFISLIIPVI